MPLFDEMPLPRFTYHPDPVGTGSIAASDKVCVSCEVSRGWIYTGPTYCEADLDGCLCPWCIGDGTAHAKFQAEFVDPAAIGDYGNWTAVPQLVIEEVAFRTPAFNGFQQERWFTHCNDAAAFVGCAGKPELESMDREVYDALKLESGYNDEQWAFYFDQMKTKSGSTAYLFRCLHCGAWGGCSDCA